MKEKNGIFWYECPKRICPFKTNPTLSYSAAAIAGNAHRRAHTEAGKK